MLDVTASTQSAPGPDWTKQVEDVHCPLCEYNLRGLVEPRCPECGHTFEWNRLLDPTQRLHPWLFEHHPRHKIWSFLMTTLGQLSPRRFWTSLHPAMPSRPRLLVLFWLVSAFLAMLTLSRPLAEAWSETAQWSNSERQRMRLPQNQAWRQHVAQQYGSVEQYLDLVSPLPPSLRFFEAMWQDNVTLRLLITAYVAYAGWPWIAALTLMIFRASMRQARVRFAHVMRCVIYSADITPVLFVFLVAGVAPAINRTLGMIPYDSFERLAWFVAGSGAYAMVSWRLIRAYQLYLRFPLAWAVVLSVQIIVALVVLQACVMVHGDEIFLWLL